MLSDWRGTFLVLALLTSLIFLHVAAVREAYQSVQRLWKTGSVLLRTGEVLPKWL